MPNEFDSYKIIHLSDLHLKEFGKNNCELLSKIDAISPDVIFITGDMVYKRKNGFDVVTTLMENLLKKYSVYYVLGNHEVALRYNQLKEFCNRLKEMGVNLLLDNNTRINKNGEHLNIYGANFKFNMEPKKVNEIVNEKYNN